MSYFLPAHALDSATLERRVAARIIDEKLLSRYSTSFEENARRAIRLGYDSFHLHYQAQQLTPTDLDILNFVQQELIPFATELQDLTDKSLQKNGRAQQVQDSFTELVSKLAKLLYKNQNRYTNPAFIDDKAALQEASDILTEALRTGNF